MGYKEKKLVEEIVSNQEIKQDDGKIDYTLLDWGAIRKLVEVREYGVKKYNKRDSWQEVSKERYIKALLRHVIAYADREENDKESGLNHLAHAMCNCMFILSGKLKEGKKCHIEIQRNINIVKIAHVKK